MTKYSRDIAMLLDRRTTLRARDGAVVDPVVDDANGIQWFFKYRKNTVGKYKWFAQGAQEPMFANTNTAISPGAINTGTAGVAVFTVPLSGFYLPETDIQIGGSGSGTSVLTWWWYIDGTTQISTWQKQVALGTLDAWAGHAFSPTEILAGHQLGLGISVSVLGPTINQHTVRARPLRVSF